MAANSVYAKLAKVQSALKVPKGQYNSFGKYKYRSCEDIVEAVKPLCHENGLLLTMADQIIQIGDRYYVSATATVTSIDDGSTAFVTANAREEDTKKGMDGSQITGTASSYARKYALNGLFAIDDTKDADTDENENQRRSAGDTRESKPHVCMDCGRPITTVVMNDGRPWDSEAIYAWSLQNYKKALCFNCISKRRAAQKSAAKT